VEKINPQHQTQKPPAMKTTVAWRSLLVKLAGSVIILIVLFRFIDFDRDSFLLTLKNLDTRLYTLSLTGVVLVLGIKSFRWLRIIQADGHTYKFSRSFGAYMASFTIGIITPGRIGEIARLYYLRQETEIGFLPAFKTIVSDRIFDLGVLVMLGIAGLLHYATEGLVSTYLAILAGILIFFLFRTYPRKTDAVDTVPENKWHVEIRRRLLRS
jgi:uncharacterized protein (TIRG00374 family)